jgi:hypothetical protein
VGAGYGQRSPDRVTKRNGYRRRDFDTRAGTIELAIPKVRRGSYFPEWPLEPRPRAEQPLTQVICQCYAEESRPAVSMTSSRPWASTASRSQRSGTWPSEQKKFYVVLTTSREEHCSPRRL